MQTPTTKNEKIDLEVVKVQARILRNFYQELGERIIRLVEERKLNSQDASNLLRFNQEDLEDKVLNLVAQEKIAPNVASWLLKYNSYSTLRERMYQKGLIDY